jgi:eukaryotic-like serine/threonine-protein kinase
MVTIGESVSHYRILEKLGGGGMGVVYRAHDEHLDRDVALKVLPAGMLADETARSRFRREALTLSHLNHPGIAVVHDFDSENGVDFLTMEYVEGETLAAKAAAGPLLEKDVIALGTQIAEALEDAHEHEIIHRDLKPANVMVTPKGRVKVLDFGLAKLVKPAAADGATASLAESQPGVVMGTVPYMAPEQLRGQKADPRTDIWAAGAVLYEMATGRRPFSETTAPLLMDAILNKAPQAPHTFNPQVSSGLQSVILKALEKDPQRRYQSAHDLSADLERLVTGALPSAAWPRRRAWIAAAAGLIILLAGGFLVWRLAGQRGKVAPSAGAPIRARRSVAVLGFKNLSGRPEVQWLSTAVSEMLTTELAAGEQLRTVPGENVARMKIDLSIPDADTYSPDTLGRMGKILNANYVVLGSYLDLGGASDTGVRLDLRLQDAGVGETVALLSVKGTETQLDDLVSRAGRELRRKLGVQDVAASEAGTVRASLPSNPDAARFYSEGLAKLRVFDAQGARGLLEKAVAAEPDYPLTHSALAAAWTSLGYDEKATQEAKKAFELSAALSREERLSVEGRYRAAAQDWGKATEIYSSLFTFFPDNLEYGLRLASAETSAGRGKEALAVVTALRQLPAPARDDPRIDLAEATAARSLSANKQAAAAAARAAAKGQELGSRLVVARARFEEGSALQNLSEMDKSKQALEEAERLFAAAGDLRGVAGSQNNIALVLMSRGDPAGARKTCEQALETYRSIGNKSGVALMQSNLGNIEYMEGNLAQARKMWQETLATYREIGEKDGVARMLNNIASALAEEGDLAGARKSFQSAFEAYREIGNQNGAASALGNIGQLALTQGDLDASQTMYEKVLETARTTGDRAMSASALLNLGKILFARRDLAGARNKEEQALKIAEETGEKEDAAQSRLSLAELSFEDGHSVEAEAQAREVGEEFRKQNALDYEASADELRARCFLAQGKLADAQTAIAQATALLAKGQNREVRFSIAMTSARVLAASGKPSDLAEATKSLEATLAEVVKAGFVGDRLEAQLALGEIGMKSGNPSAARARLGTLEVDARAKGFLLIARKAAKAKR